MCSEKVSIHQRSQDGSAAAVSVQMGGNGDTREFASQRCSRQQLPTGQLFRKNIGGSIRTR